MPTDEQREQFEQLMKGQGHKAFNRSGDGKYLNDHRLDDKWLGYQARDAEVQALREALSDVEVTVTVTHFLTVDALTHVLDVVARKAAYALRGEEGTNHE